VRGFLVEQLHQLRRMAAAHGKEDRLAHLVRDGVTPCVVQKAADRSENGDYLYGKKRLREIDRRIRFLTKRLDIAEIVDPSRQENRDQVFFGATVTYLRNGSREERITIVGIDEVDPAHGHVSWISPVAKALMKAREGDIVSLRTPAGVDELEILEVAYPTA